MRLLLICAAAVLLIYPFTIAHADDGYWIKARFTMGPIPGEESKSETVPTEILYTMYFSERYLRIDEYYWDEYSEKDQGEEPSLESVVVDFAEKRQYSIDHNLKRVVFKEFKEGQEIYEFLSNPFLATCGQVDTERSFEDMIDQIMSQYRERDDDYTATELGERTILGFPAYGVLIEPVREEKPDSGESGALGSAMGAAAAALAGGEMWFEYWYSEDLGMIVLMRIAMFHGLMELEVVEYEPWSPTAEEMRLPEGYELVYDTRE